jgi:subtilase family serine protease
MSTPLANRRVRAFVAGLSLATLLVGGCSIGRGAPQPAQFTAPPTAPLTADAPDMQLGPTDPAEFVDYTVSLVLPGESELAAFLAGLNDPASADYRHYIDAGSFGARFGLPAAEIDAVVAWLEANRMEVVFRPPQRTSLTVRGRAADVERLFAVTLTDWQTAEGQRYHRPNGVPQLPASMIGRVASVVGLDNEPVVRPALAGIYGTGVPNGGMRPDEVAKAYEIDALHAAGFHGEGQTVAIVSFDTFYPADIDAWDLRMGITAAPPVEKVSLADAPDTPTGDNDEVSLDIEVIRGIAPAAQILNYEADNRLSNFGRLVSRIVADGRADLVNISWGKCEKYYDSTIMDSNEQELAAAFSAGISIFVAAGDDGAYDCRRNRVSDSDPFARDLTPNVDSPSSSTSVISVGGTYLTVRQDGTYYDEAGWEEPLSGGGGGGGLSTVYGRPAWQQGNGVDNGQSNGMRQLPDVAGPADPSSGFIVVYTPPDDDQQVTSIGGTSAAAPFWVGSMALVRQAANAQGIDSLGALGPLLYQVAAARPDVFHDVVRGGNLLHQAGPGWDYSTGLGTPRVSPLADAIIAALSR